MNYDEAMRILMALVEGHDPISDKPLPADSVVQNAQVLRALLMAHGALQTNVDRRKRRSALPPRVGTPWTEEEDQRLITARKEQQTVEHIASSHGRTIRAIESRLERLGLITAEERTTSVAFGQTSPSGSGGPDEGAPRRKRGRPRGGSFAPAA